MAFTPKEIEIMAAAAVGTAAAAATKVEENAPISPGTKTKIAYDAKGLVTGGADATTADIADSANKRYCTDAEKASLGNTISGDLAVLTANMSIGANRHIVVSGEFNTGAFGVSCADGAVLAVI